MMTEVLQLMVLCLAAGLGSGQAPKGGLLEKWSGVTPNADYQICNLANIGVIVSHNLNTGQVVVNGSMYRRLSSREKRVLEGWLQTYQNRNVRHRITVRTQSRAGNVVTEPVHAVASSAPPARLRVLCIEDSQTHARQLRTAMAGSRIDMLAAPDLTVALGWLAKNHVDAVVIALNRSGTQAQTMLDRARTLAVRMPVVVIAAFDDQAMRRDAIARGFADFAPKANMNVALLQYMIENSIDRFRKSGG